MAFSGVYFTQIKQVLHNLISNSSAEYGPLYIDNLDVVSPTQDTTPYRNSGSDTSSEGSSEQTNNSNEYTESPYPGILDTDLTALTSGQKKFFIATVSILCVISIFGNLSTLVVNFRRKIRPFFRACLVSLAFSDLMNTVFLSTAYLSQFMTEYVQIWSLGPLMCNLVPFATTAAILASSMTLVGIAVDRYYAVMKVVIGFWQPTVISCAVCMLCIWLASIGIACPVFSIYDLLPVYILTEEHETDVSGGGTTSAATATSSAESRLLIIANIGNNTGAAVAAATATVFGSTVPVTVAGVEATGTQTKTSWEMEASQEDLSYTLVREQKLVDMCISDQKDVTLYYVIVFVIIFIPCIGAFFWFNTIIARKLWKRRHSATITKRSPKSISNSKIKAKDKIDTAPPMELASPRTLTTGNLGNFLQPQCQNCNCRSGQSTSTTMPSSLMATMGGTAGTTTTTNNTGPRSSNSPPINGPSRNSREARHLRMFTIILLMMAVFVFLRLPAWIFLLMRMYGSYSKPVDWIIYFVFGILNLASSVLNPLFYTFLTETIQYVLRFKAKVTALICTDCSLCGCCRRHGNGKPVSAGATAPTMTNIKEPRFALSCCENVCGCTGFLRATWQCQQPQSSEIRRQQPYSSGQLGAEFNNKDEHDPEAVYCNDKDEGVDCSDGVEEEDDFGDFNIYNRRIYTIYPASLVSTSSQ